MGTVGKCRKPEEDGRWKEHMQNVPETPGRGTPKLPDAKELGTRESSGAEAAQTEEQRLRG